MQENLLNRKDMSPNMQWDLSKIYLNDNEYEKDFAKVQDLIEKVLTFKGTLHHSAVNLKNAIEAVDNLTRLTEKLYVYSHLKSDEDISNNINKARINKIQATYAEMSGVIAFFEPEILAIDDNIMQEFLATEDLIFYKRSLLELLRDKSHTLSEKEERLVGLYSSVMSGSSEIFSILNDDEINFGKLKMDDGKKVALSHGNYRLFLEDKNRKNRKKAFKLMFKSYKKYRNTFASTLGNTVKKHAISAKLRNYSSALNSALSKDNIKDEVYTNLISAVHGSLHYMKDYLKLRQEILQLKNLDMYDLYTPLVQGVNKKYTFDEAVELVKKALAPLGEEYGKVLERAFSERWIDIYENKGKRSGAYSSGCYDSFPYILLNFNGTLNDVFTLAHEIGHSLHSYYSNSNQEYHYADYSIFVAEVASTTNEMLLSDYLIKNNHDNELKMYLYDHLANDIRATVFRQTMFAEFELEIHKLAEDNIPLTADVLSQKYYELNKFYYPEMRTNKLIEMEWARIPHFYYNFYVYKYATGMAAAVALSRNILSGDKEKIANYFDFLKAGSSKDVLDIMKDAGVDLSTEKPIVAALDYFGEVVKLMKELYVTIE